jgi:hypothetical protein
MFLRSAAMTTAVTLGGAVFMAGAAAGAGLTLATLGSACVARRAMKRRSDWGRHRDEPLQDHRVAGDDEPHPGVPNPG